MYQNQIQDYYDMKALSLHEGSKIINIQLEKWSEIPVAKDFITGQIRTLDTACSLNLQLGPGPLAVEKLERLVYELIVQIGSDLYFSEPPEIYSASRKVEAFVLLNARVSAWLAAWPELTPETIALSVREDQNYNTTERETLDNYQAQLQKHHSQILQALSSIYDKLIKNTKQYYGDLRLDEFARLRAFIAGSEGQLGIPQSSYLQGPVSKLLRLIRERAYDDLFVRKPPRYTSIDLMQRIIALTNEALPAYGFPFRISEEPVAGVCAICIEELRKEDDNKKPEDILLLHYLRGELTPVSKHDVAVLRCGHSYHVGCALEWYIQLEAIRPNCPLCREPL